MSSTHDELQTEKNEKYVASRYNYIQEAKDGGWLVYNSLSRKIIKIPLRFKQKVEKILKGTEGVEINSALKEYRLVKDGFLVKQDYHEGYAAHAQYLKEIGDSDLGLTIVPTFRCNCRCPYCYQDHEKGMILGRELQDAIIKFIKKNISRYTGVQVSWFGGEPLLCSESILYMNNEIKKICAMRYKTFKSSITSNGYLLSKGLFEKLLSSGVRRYFITVDGLKDMHDKQRYLADGKGSYERIIRNLEDIKTIARTKDFIVNIRTNVSKELFVRLEDYVADMSSRFGDDSRFGFFFRPVFDWGGDSIDGFRDHLLDEKQGFADIFNKLTESKYDLNYLMHYSDLTQSSICYASRINHFVINPDGSINKCTCADTGGNNLVGQLLTTGEMELDYGKTGMWSTQYLEDSECEKCYLMGQCLKSYCVSGQVLNQTQSKNCYIAKYACGEILSLLDKCNAKYHYIDEIEL